MKKPVEQSIDGVLPFERKTWVKGEIRHDKKGTRQKDHYTDAEWQALADSHHEDWQTVKARTEAACLRIIGKPAPWAQQDVHAAQSAKDAVLRLRASDGMQGDELAQAAFDAGAAFIIALAHASDGVAIFGRKFEGGRQGRAARKTKGYKRGVDARNESLFLSVKDAWEEFNSTFPAKATCSAFLRWLPTERELRGMETGEAADYCNLFREGDDPTMGKGSVSVMGDQVGVVSFAQIRRWIKELKKN